MTGLASPRIGHAEVEPTRHHSTAREFSESLRLDRTPLAAVSCKVLAAPQLPEALRYSHRGELMSFQDASKPFLGGGRIVERESQRRRLTFRWTVLSELRFIGIAIGIEIELRSF
jgi:hypothetical protein